MLIVIETDENDSGSDLIYLQESIILKSENSYARGLMIYDPVDPVPQGEIITDNKYLFEILEYARKRNRSFLLKIEASLLLKEVTLILVFKIIIKSLSS